MNDIYPALINNCVLYNLPKCINCHTNKQDKILQILKNSDNFHSRDQVEWHIKHLIPPPIPNYTLRYSGVVSERNVLDDALRSKDIECKQTIKLAAASSRGGPQTNDTHKIFSKDHHLRKIYKSSNEEDKASSRQFSAQHKRKFVEECITNSHPVEKSSEKPARKSTNEKVRKCASRKLISSSSQVISNNKSVNISPNNQNSQTTKSAIKLNTLKRIIRRPNGQKRAVSRHSNGLKRTLIRPNDSKRTFGRQNFHRRARYRSKSVDNRPDKQERCLRIPNICNGGTRDNLRRISKDKAASQISANSELDNLLPPIESPLEVVKPLPLDISHRLYKKGFPRICVKFASVVPTRKAEVEKALKSESKPAKKRRLKRKPPPPSPPNGLSSTGELIQPPKRLNTDAVPKCSGDGFILDSLIPTRTSFFGTNNPFKLGCTESLRQARSVLCNRKLEWSDLTKSRSRIRKRKGGLNIEASRQIWRQQNTSAQPDNTDSGRQADDSERQADKPDSQRQADNTDRLTNNTVTELDSPVVHADNNIRQSDNADIQIQGDNHEFTNSQNINLTCPIARCKGNRGGGDTSSTFNNNLHFKSVIKLTGSQKRKQQSYSYHLTPNQINHPPNINGQVVTMGQTATNLTVEPSRPNIDETPQQGRVTRGQLRSRSTGGGAVGALSRTRGLLSRNHVITGRFKGTDGEMRVFLHKVDQHQRNTEM